MLINTGKGINRGRCLSKSIGAAKWRGRGGGGEGRTVARGDRCRDKRFRGGSIRIQHLAHASTPEPVFQARANPVKSPSCRRDIDWFTVERWPSLISNQPRLRLYTYVDVYARVCVRVARWAVSVDALYTSFNVSPTLFQSLPPLISHEHLARIEMVAKVICAARVEFGRKKKIGNFFEKRLIDLKEKTSPLLRG